MDQHQLLEAEINDLVDSLVQAKDIIHDLESKLDQLMGFGKEINFHQLRQLLRALTILNN
jgi:hypothetical protein